MKTLYRNLFFAAGIGALCGISYLAGFADASGRLDDLEMLIDCLDIELDALYQELPSPKDPNDGD